MTSMIIEYDLCSPGRNYDELYKAIKAYGTWAHITEVLKHKWDSLRAATTFRFCILRFTPLLHHLLFWGLN